MKRLIQQWRRDRYANRMGWRSLGLLIRACLDNRPQVEIDRLIRYSNRLYRLNYGKSPWHQHEGF